MSTGEEFTEIANELRTLADRVSELAIDEGHEPDLLTPGARLARARNRARLSQVQLSELSGVSVNAIIKFEKGKTRPRDRTLMALAEHVELHWTSLKEDSADELQEG
jgi:DNA-binding XRE family transcriptional regulator